MLLYKIYRIIQNNNNIYKNEHFVQLYFKVIGINKSLFIYLYLFI